MVLQADPRAERGRTMHTNIHTNYESNSPPRSWYPLIPRISTVEERPTIVSYFLLSALKNCEL